MGRLCCDRSASAPWEHLPGASKGSAMTHLGLGANGQPVVGNKPSEGFKPPLLLALFQHEPSQWGKHLPPICSLLPARAYFFICQRFCLESKSCILEWTSTPGLPMAESLIPAVNVAFSSESTSSYVWQLQLFQEGEKYSSLCWLSHCNLAQPAQNSPKGYGTWCKTGVAGSWKAQVCQNMQHLLFLNCPVDREQWSWRTSKDVRGCVCIPEHGSDDTKRREKPLCNSEDCIKQ